MLLRQRDLHSAGSHYCGPFVRPRRECSGNRDVRNPILALMFVHSLLCSSVSYRMGESSLEVEQVLACIFISFTNEKINREM